ncbi:signal peptidase II [Mesomycoplasma lagogenitalium]|uniref:Signal peptidase II n=1 Tax=Mesomycoplasma lagogenitalium TaxID=171286 RepID=A0ABY8LTS6_9BACT|nr:signal peptidase II [Mesomycoplasma lagogenitalium]WGI36638.1 signal peptidase II [Mesomycoplasma lagogenitalium]
MKDKANKVLNDWKKSIIAFNRKKLIINSILTVSILLILTLIDQLSKNLIFEHKYFTAKPNWNENNTIIDYGFIGFRPLMHYGVTSGLERLFGGFWFIHLFSLIIVIVTPYWMVFSKRYYLLVFIGFLWSGTFGNMIDRFMYNNGVKDILFIPWRDNGTFNFADIFIIIGAIGVSLSFIYISLIESHLEKRKQIRSKAKLNEQESLNQVIEKEEQEK